MRHIDTLPQSLGSAIVLGLLTGAIVFITSAWLLWQIPWPADLPNFVDQLQHWLAMRINQFMPHMLVNGAVAYHNYLGRLPPSISPWMLAGRFDLAAGLGLAVGGIIIYLTAQPISAIRHVAGRRLYIGKTGQRLVRQLAKTDCAKSADGLLLHPDFEWRLSLDRETRHFIMIGSIGGGKTVIINPLVQAAIGRGDRLVIYDNKGDYSTWLPEGTLFAPWDLRSSAWDIGRDCRTKLDAQELAARLIPESQDPLWHTAARQIMSALVIKLQSECGTAWGWRELYTQACQSREDLLPIVRRYLPEARHVVEAPEKTSLSILANFGAHLTLLADLAVAWGSMPAARRVSLMDWLDNPNTKNRVLILQGSGQYVQLAQSYIQSMVTLMAGHINSPAFPDSRVRRVWFILDEFPQLGKLSEVAPLLEVGRSKGIRVVLGAQDLDQIKAIYGDHTARSWGSMIGTQIIVRVNAGETANYLSKDVIGYRTIDRTVIHQGEPQAPIRENVLVMEPAELQSDLGPTKTGVDALLLGFGDAFILHWPFTSMRQLRKPSVPATWMQTAAAGPTTPKDSTQIETPDTTTASADTVSTTPASKGSTKARSRLFIRPQSKDLLPMAENGTAIVAAAEPAAELTNSAAGGNHESC